jgi:glutamate dehydrogenase
MALGIEEDKLTPNQLISAILKSPVDLLWNGGIGTYVKCSTEGNVDAGDRINDVLRVNGNDLRCKVVGEGGNLGLTQKGRIEASLNGVRINTDAMDNSAGVACSDREVNIKIALSAAMKSEKVSLKERNVILEKMSDEVSALVLKDNESQTSAISITQSEGYLGLGAKMQFLNNLEHSGLLNRSVEFLPADKEILKRQADKVGMTRPELCVILSYSKMDLYPKILDSELVKDTYFNRELSGYFPTLLQKKFPEEIKNHQLKSEIIATLLTNSVIDKAGITFVDKIAGETGFSSAYIVRNYVIVRDSFNLNDLWRQIDELSGKVDIKIRSRMFATIHKLMERCVVWLLRHQHKIDIETAIVKYNAIATQLFDILDDILAKASRESYNNKIKRYHEGKVPMKLAKMVAALDPLASAFDIAEIANKSNFNIREIAKIYFEVGTRFSLKWLRGKVSTIAVDNYWQKLALKSISEDLYDYQMKIAKEIVEFSCKNKDICPVSPSMNYWVDNNEFMVKRYDDFVGNLKENLNPDLSNFVVALSRARILF